MVAGAVFVLEGPLPDSDELTAALAAHLPEPRDLRHVVLPPPGGDEELFRIIGEATGGQCWVVEGLAGDRWAVLLPAADPAPPGWIDRVRDAIAARPVAGMRRYSAVQVPRAAVDRVCRTFDVTIDGVALSALTDSFRAALLRRGEAPRHDSVPVSGMVTALPVDEVDRVAQLLAVRRRLTGAGRHRSCVGAVLSVLEFLTSLSRHDVVAVTTDVSGPGRPQTLAGRAVVRMLPVPPPAPGPLTAVAILQDGDGLVFGISSDADADAAPDVDEIAFGIKKAMACLAAAARRPRSGRPALAMIHPSVANG